MPILLPSLLPVLLPSLRKLFRTCATTITVPITEAEMRTMPPNDVGVIKLSHSFCPCLWNAVVVVSAGMEGIHNGREQVPVCHVRTWYRSVKLLSGHVSYLTMKDLC